MPVPLRQSFRRVVGSLRAFLQRKNSKPAFTLRDAVQIYRAGKFRQAAEMFHQIAVTSSGTRQLQAFLLFGHVSLELGDVVTACETFEKCIPLNNACLQQAVRETEKGHDYTPSIGICLSLVGKTREAVALLTPFLDNRPDHEHTHALYALLCCHEDHNDWQAAAAIAGRLRRAQIAHSALIPPPL